MKNRNALKHNLTPQQRKVLKALGEGHSVTKLTAIHQRIGNIHDVIMKLRNMGWAIETLTKQDINGDDYTAYVMRWDHRQYVAGRLATRVAA